MQKLDPVIQTRNQDGHILYWTSLSEAFKHATDIDDTIWKISFNSASSERIRLVRHLNINGDTVWIFEDLMNEVRKEITTI